MEIKALIIQPNTVSHFHTDEFDAGKINEIVGGYFTTVGGQEFIGYVHDEGLMLRQEFNPLASALFGSYLVGTCVVVGGISPTGEYDGENYDCPESAIAKVNWWLTAQAMHRDFDGVTASDMVQMAKETTV
jgi:hypothetical protein